MIMSTRIIVSGLLLSGAMVGCTEPPSAVPEQSAQPAPVSAPAGSALPPPATAKVDPFSVEDLKAGLDAMMPRIVATIDGYSRVAPRVDSRISLHPDIDKNASIEFDLSGLNTLTLSPYIGDFSRVSDCEGSADAGVVRMRWSLDAGTPNEVMVDRNYAGTIVVDTLGAKRLKVEVDKGNDQIWCDWFGLGVVKIQ